METNELVARLAQTLKAEVGPAVADEYARTQAFMASVILTRVGRELALGPDHARAEQADLAHLTPDLVTLLTGAPAPVEAAVEALARNPTVAGLGPVIEALYAWADADPIEGVARRDRALASIRPVLRRDIDRRMEVAR